MRREEECKVEMVPKVLNFCKVENEKIAWKNVESLSSL